MRTAVVKYREWLFSLKFIPERSVEVMNLLIFTTLLGNIISFSDNGVNFSLQSPVESMAKFM